MGDVGGGALYLVTGMLAGLLNARLSGSGTVVDAAVVDGSAHMMNLLMSGRAAGLLRPERGQSLLDGPPWSRCYRCADGEWLSVQCLEPRFYAVFLQKLGVEGDASLRQDPDPHRWPAISERLSEIIVANPLPHWETVFENSDACVAAVREPTTSASDSHMLARQTWVEIDGQLQARAAPRFNGKPPTAPGKIPARGEHTDEILEALQSP